MGQIRKNKNAKGSALCSSFCFIFWIGCLSQKIVHLPSFLPPLFPVFGRLIFESEKMLFLFYFLVVSNSIFEFVLILLFAPNKLFDCTVISSYSS